jgi:hypothetical protein
VIVEVVVVTTAVAVTVKFAEVLPAVTVTVAGTVTLELLELERVTTSPPGPAGPVRVTVPVVVFELAIGLAARVTLATVGRLTVMTAFWDEAPRVPVIVEVFTDATAREVTVKLAEL